MTCKPAAMVMIALTLMIDTRGSIAAGASQAVRKPTTVPPQAVRPKPDPQPTAELRERMSKLFEMRRARMARAAKLRAATVERERAQFLRQQRATVEGRNAKTRAELGTHLREADSPAARAAGRRVEIGREAAELLRRSKTATPAEQAIIERRAGELSAELGRLRE